MRVVAKFLVVSFFILIVSANAFGATFTMEFKNMPAPTGIESFAVFFLVDDSFSYTKDSLSFGDGVPSGPAPGALPTEIDLWKFANANPNVTPNNQFVIDLYNSDTLDTEPTFVTIPGAGVFQTTDGIYREDNLINGIIVSFDFESNSEMKLLDFLALNSFGEPVDYQISVNFDNTNIIFSAVPIPSTLLLLGGGIVALVGGTRRKIGGK